MKHILSQFVKLLLPSTYILIIVESKYSTGDDNVAAKYKYAANRH